MTRRLRARDPIFRRANRNRTVKPEVSQGGAGRPRLPLNEAGAASLSPLTLSSTCRPRRPRWQQTTNETRCPQARQKFKSRRSADSGLDPQLGLSRPQPQSRPARDARAVPHCRRRPTPPRPEGPAMAVPHNPINHGVRERSARARGPQSDRERRLRLGSRIGALDSPYISQCHGPSLFADSHSPRRPRAAKPTQLKVNGP